MKNMETWKEANEFFPNQLLKVSLFLLLTGLILAVLSLPRTLLIALIPTILLPPCSIWMIWTTEQHLKKTFDEEGRRKGEPAPPPGEASLESLPTTPESFVLILKVTFALATVLFAATALVELLWYHRLPEQIYIHFDLQGNPSPWTVGRAIGLLISQAILFFSWVTALFVYLYVKRSFKLKQVPYTRGALSVPAVLLSLALAVCGIHLGALYYNLTGAFPLSPLYILVLAAGIPVLLLLLLHLAGYRW